jgi:amino acid adenylation domain-containing protein
VKHSVNDNLSESGKVFRPLSQPDLDRSIASCFELRVNRYPCQLAIKTNEHQFTYDRLNQAANRVARAILAKSAVGNVPIPILCGHGAMMLVAMFGILKAGKAWVPIDPSYPPERIAYLLDTFQSSLIITDRGNSSLAKSLITTGCQIVNIDEIDRSLSTENLNLPISPDAIACILPTSGSTGEPKGVIHSHRTLLHACLRWTKARSICPEDRALAIGSYCHIGGTNHLLATLLNGATVYPFNIKELGLTNLADWMIAEKITIYHSVSTVFRHFINSLNPQDDFPHLRLINIGGEPVFAKDFELCKKYFSADWVFLNSFGCTEISSYRHYALDRSSQVNENVLPIGYAAQDTKVLLLNELGEAVADGTIGEIVVQSPYLALGYWQRPDLDARSFVPDPPDGNQRLYRTGDLGRMSSDGCLMNLGRKDSQIKIRGYRVELSECEAALSEHSQISEVAVIARYTLQELATADRELEQSAIAYIVLDAGATISSQTLAKFLQTKLPSYLIPARFIFLDTLPINANGKVDRLALTQLTNTSYMSSSAAYTAPRTVLERQLATLWAEALQLERVGIDDNFFALGGHSLLAVSLFSQISKVLGHSLSLTTLFEKQTIAEQAAIIEATISPDRDRFWRSVVKIKQGNSTKLPLFLLHDMSGSVLFYQQLVNHLPADRTCYAIQPQGLNGIESPISSVREMAACYIQEIRKIQPVGPYHLIGYSFGGILAFEMAQQLQTQSQAIGLLAILDSQAPINTENLPTPPNPQSPTTSHRNFSRLSKFLSFNYHDKIHYLRCGLEIHRTFGKLRIPYQFYLRYIKRSLPELGRLDVYRTNTQAYHSYRNQSNYAGTATIFFSGEKISALSSEPQLGWDRHIAGKIAKWVCPGTNHGTLIQEPSVRLLAEKLTIELTASDGLPINGTENFFSHNQIRDISSSVKP